ncbi:putative methyltransferase [Meyerozyma sp. JA9]|nr:putative methyltransferase [Meyerozyma sp. JA9]
MAKRKISAPEKPTKKPSKSMPKVEVALCVPSTVISHSNARNLQHATFIAYQIAKAATLYNVSEIVVLSIPDAEVVAEKTGPKVVSAATGGQKIMFDDVASSPKTEQNHKTRTDDDSLVLATLLQYFVTPPYLVKAVFKDSKFRKKFKYAEKLPKIPSLPFMANNDVHKDFKEGLSVAKKTPKIVKKNKKVPGKKLSVTKYVNIGGDELLELAGPDIPVNVRVTVDVKNKQVVSPRDAYGVSGNKSTFGYFVRVSRSFTSIFTESTFPSGYTKSYYISCDDFYGKPDTGIKKETFGDISEGKVLLVMSNWKDLEASFSVEAFEGVDKVSELFDGELEMEQGIRVEDAVMVGLARCRI